MNREQRLLRRIQVLLGMVALGLIVSGLTAFGIETELRWTHSGSGDTRVRLDEFRNCR